jgi:hypothetical protein
MGLTLRRAKGFVQNKLRCFWGAGVPPAAARIAKWAFENPQVSELSSVLRLRQPRSGAVRECTLVTKQVIQRLSLDSNMA